MEEVGSLHKQKFLYHTFYLFSAMPIGFMVGLHVALHDRQPEIKECFQIMHEVCISIGSYRHLYCNMHESILIPHMWVSMVNNCTLHVQVY